MLCTHSKLDKIVSKDQRIVYEVCWKCQKLMLSYPYVETMDIPYIMPHVERYKIFEKKPDGEYRIQTGKIIFSPRMKEGKWPPSVIKPTYTNPTYHSPVYQPPKPDPKPTPLFFTNMTEEEIALTGSKS